LNDIINAIRSFHRKKIKVHGMFVLGGDNDNARTVWDTVRFAIKQKIDTIQMSILTPFPGTKVHADLKQEKRIFSTDWDLYDGQHIVFTPKLLTAETLQMNVVRAYTRFYSLTQCLKLLVRMHFRNAMFRLMGYKIVRQWVQQNKALSWLPAAANVVKG
jgi:anaerobic magnesium-protoporphyrin IX monomethyl ester cyclase